MREVLLVYLLLLSVNVFSGEESASYLEDGGSLSSIEDSVGMRPFSRRASAPRYARVDDHVPQPRWHTVLNFLGIRVLRPSARRRAAGPMRFVESIDPRTSYDRALTLLRSGSPDSFEIDRHFLRAMAGNIPDAYYRYAVWQCERLLDADREVPSRHVFKNIVECLHRAGRGHINAVESRHDMIKGKRRKIPMPEIIQAVVDRFYADKGQEPACQRYAVYLYRRLNKVTTALSYMIPLVGHASQELDEMFCEMLRKGHGRFLKEEDAHRLRQRLRGLSRSINLNATEAYAVMCLKGIGGREDFEEGRIFYGRAAESTGASPRIRYEAAMLHLDSEVGIFYPRGLEFLRSAANDGYTEAQIELARALHTGRYDLDLDADDPDKLIFNWRELPPEEGEGVLISLMPDSGSGAGSGSGYGAESGAAGSAEEHPSVEVVIGEEGGTRRESSGSTLREFISTRPLDSAQHDPSSIPSELSDATDAGLPAGAAGAGFGAGWVPPHFPDPKDLLPGLARDDDDEGHEGFSAYPTGLGEAAQALIDGRDMRLRRPPPPVYGAVEEGKEED